MKLNTIRVNTANPRAISGDKFHKLINSLRQFPDMMDKRPIVVDVDGTILGGNMRYRALCEIYGADGEIPDSWVVVARDWTDEQKREFIIKDNASFGVWNMDELRADWDTDELGEWGVDVPEWEDPEIGDTDVSIKERKEDFCTCPKCGFQWSEK